MTDDDAALAALDRIAAVRGLRLVGPPELRADGWWFAPATGMHVLAWKPESPPAEGGDTDA